jgi:hypothetical protein
MRPVWLRVIVDDRKTLERELPANQRLDFTAEKAIVIRAGDAGAIRLRLSGEDRGTLGEDGQVVTRRFTTK